MYVRKILETFKHHILKNIKPFKKSHLKKNTIITL